MRDPEILCLRAEADTHLEPAPMRTPGGYTQVLVGELPNCLVGKQLRWSASTLRVANTAKQGCPCSEAIGRRTAKSPGGLTV